MSCVAVLSALLSAVCLDPRPPLFTSVGVRVEASETMSDVLVTDFYSITNCSYYRTVPAMTHI